MPLSKTEPASNNLLAAMSRKEHLRFLSDCTLVDLELADILIEPGERTRYVYFPTESFISLITVIDNNSCLEVGQVGNEGMLGISLVLGVGVSPLRAVVQGAGQALRMDAAPFQREFEQNPVLQRELKRYLNVMVCQLAQTAACTHFHLVEARLARWLLMTHDRAQSDTFYITHEFLAYMLGVRRVGVTNAATALQNRNLIQYSRGNITILDRKGLEGASCDCYAADLANYSRIIGNNLAS